MAEIISNGTYNLLAVLLSKLEGLEAYDEYMEDMTGEGKNVIAEIRKDDERHAQMLRDTIENLVKEGGFR